MLGKKVIKSLKQLGLTRNRLYVKAIKEFIEHQNKDKITEKLNDLYAKNTEKNELNDASLKSLREATKNDSW
ncbi:MAG: ChpI protein [Spirochaetales bacterium]|nr:ChpI protein [Spirochaetales bacterium]